MRVICEGGDIVMPTEGGERIYSLDNRAHYYYIGFMQAILDNPRLHPNGSMEGVKLLYSEGTRFEYELSGVREIDFQSVMRSADEGLPIEPHLLAYGKWEVYEMVEEVVKKREDYDPSVLHIKLTYGHVDALSATVEREAFERVNRGERIEPRKTTHYGSIAYPIYMNVVDNPDEFIMSSLVPVLRHEYLAAFNTYLALVKSDDVFASARKYARDVPWIIYRKMAYLSLYVRDTERFWREVERTLRGLIMDDAYISNPEDFEYSGDYRIAYREVLEEIRRNF